MYVGKVIRDIRISKNIPSNKVYKNILSRPAIAKFEKGLSDTTVEKFFEIINVLNITLEEFEVIYSLHEDNIYKYCLYYLRDVEKASDITREAFLNFYKYYETVDSDAMLKCLLYEAKQLLSNNQHQELARREALE